MSGSPDPAKASIARSNLQDWLVERSLPLWSEIGWDPHTGLFLERLDGNGRPLPDIPRRLMVQARQIFTFSVAARRGWCRSAADRLERAGDAMVRFYYGQDGSPGWAFSVDRFGALIDPRRDLYTLAFVLLALSKLATTCGDRRALTLADETLDFLDRDMASASGGYIDALPPPQDGQLRQNPHMHLLEALLALHEAAPHGVYIDRARDIVSLLTTRFLQGRPPVLAEYFDADWTARGGPDVPFEPGHHFEWAWLLTRYAHLANCSPPDVLDPLWTAATVVGLGPGGIIYDEVSVSRGALQRSTRLWPYCEAAKAACARSQPDLVDGFLTTLSDRFLAPAFPGSWIDHFGLDGAAKTSYAPASSLYHICCAADVIADA